jgi:hypothetical protein
MGDVAHPLENGDRGESPLTMSPLADRPFGGYNRHS